VLFHTNTEFVEEAARRIPCIVWNEAKSTQRLNVQHRDYQQPSIGAGSTVRSLPGLSVLGAATALAHGLGAMFNHACRCHVGHRADVCTMYTLALYFTMVNAVRCVLVREDSARSIFYVMHVSHVSSLVCVISVLMERNGKRQINNVAAVNPGPC
jgi:uracil phosphoribosyltransferase